MVSNTIKVNGNTQKSKKTKKYTGEVELLKTGLGSWMNKTYNIANKELFTPT